MDYYKLLFCLLLFCCSCFVDLSFSASTFSAQFIYLSRRKILSKAKGLSLWNFRSSIVVFGCRISLLVSLDFSSSRERVEASVFLS